MLRSIVLFSLCSGAMPTPAENPAPQAEIILQHVAKEAVYLGMGVALTSASILARLGWEAFQISPWASTLGNECLLLHHLLGTMAHYSLKQAFRGPNLEDPQQSWNFNQALLAQIHPSSPEEKELLHFLQNRWLAKSTGLIPSMVNWIYPCFGFHVQIHPQSTHSYARNPSEALLSTYETIVQQWKKHLPHPSDFPLILTRPHDIRSYLPSYREALPDENIAATVERAGSEAIIDLTSVLPSLDKAKWLQSWHTYRLNFLKACQRCKVDPSKMICVQRLQQGEVGGLRLLPLSEDHRETQSQFLLEWVSRFGLTANRVELDRWTLLPEKEAAEKPALTFLSKEDFLTFLQSFQWTSDHPQKRLMVQSTLQLLKGLFSNQEKWKELKNAEASVAEIAFFKIQQQLSRLAQEPEDAPFFTIASHLELIHADLSSLLEVFSPFVQDDFAKIYQNALTSMPSSLKPLISSGIHSSGMSCMTGILKAVERNVQKAPRVLFGENTYFETSLALQKMANASPLEETTELDWKDADLIIAQFNPVLKRLDLEPAEYKVENIAEMLRKIFQTKREKPLTVALDCTLDFINSPRVEKLLSEFQKEIESGRLNIIGYRSGLKFDLFGMDNYCGAPLYMIHNKDEKWKDFDALLTDPILQADRLSLNWFCLAYQNTAPQLDGYRKQIFENTRAVMNKIPPRLFENNNYRVIPAKSDADLAFIDIKVFGPLHKLRSCLYVSGCLYLHSLEEGHPIFNRPSLGFYHPNFTMIFTEEFSTIRLTIGLDPAQVDTLARCFEIIDTLNGGSEQTAIELLTCR